MPRKNSAKQYECMFVLNANKFNSDPEGVTAHILELITKCGGEVVAHRPWQEGKLAYEIDGHRKGVHYLALFTSDSTTTNTELDRAVKLSEFVLRHLVIRPPAEVFQATVAALGQEPESEIGQSTEEASGGEAEAPAEEEAQPAEAAAE